MQVMSLKSSYSAVQRGEAAYLIAAMSDSMRANPDGVRRESYEGLTPGTPATAPRTTPQQVAQYDFDVWHQAINATFPHDPSEPATAPTGTINCPIRWNCIIEITWMDSRAESQLQNELGTSARYNHIVSVVF